MEEPNQQKQLVVACGAELYPRPAVVQGPVFLAEAVNLHRRSVPAVALAVHGEDRLPQVAFVVASLKTLLAIQNPYLCAASVARKRQIALENRFATVSPLLLQFLSDVLDMVFFDCLWLFV